MSGEVKGQAYIKDTTDVQMTLVHQSCSTYTGNQSINKQLQYNTDILMSVMTDDFPVAASQEAP